MSPIRKNGKPGVLEVESWFAIVVAAVGIAGFGFGVLRGAVLDNKCLKDTEARSLTQGAELVLLHDDMVQLKTILPLMQADIRDIKETLHRR